MMGRWSDHFPGAAAAAKKPEASPRKENGIWSEIFPDADKQPPTPPPRSQRCLLCPHCNAATCRILTANTPQNRGRQFYKCPADDKFVKWADEVSQNEFIDVPYCGGCTAGVCRVRRETRGSNTGRILFMCRVKEGEGSCGYRVWQDELEKSAMSRAEETINSSEPAVTCNDTGTPKTDLVEEGKQTDEGPDILSPRLEKSARSRAEETINLSVNCNDTGTPKTDLVEESKQTDEGPDILSPWLEKSARSRAEETIKSSEPAVNCNDTGTPKTDLVEESKQTDEGPNILSPRLDTSDCKMITRKMGESKCQEDKLDESSRRPHKRSRRGDAIASASFQSLKVRLSKNYVPINNSWIAEAHDQNLSSQLRGWWGRLAFRPMLSLPLVTYTSQPFTWDSSFRSDFKFWVQGQILVDNIDSFPLSKSCVGVEIYSKPLVNLKKCRNALHFIPTVQDEILENSSDLITKSRSLLQAEGYNEPVFAPVQHHDAETSDVAPFHVALDVPSCSESSNQTIVQNVMSQAISNAFCEAAGSLQNYLVAKLETMDVKDHKAMSQAAEATFDALDRLLFDHQEFEKRVKDLIHYASLMADIEQAMPTYGFYEKLVEHCSCERMKLEEINVAHTEAINIATNHKKRLKGLQEEIYSTMDWLSKIQAEISCLEAEMRSMEHELEEISKNKEVLEGKYLKASKELEESQKLFEQKEAERNAAKAAFDRARALLLG